MRDRNARMERLEDEAAIRNLIASYGPLADCGEAVALAELWTEDGVYCVGGYGEAKGREQIAALINSQTHQELMQTGCAHILSAPAVQCNGSTATAVNHSVVYRNQGDSFQPWRVSANRWALVKTGGTWLVSRRDNCPLNGEEAARALLEF